jgi:hypothetical protein
MIIHVKSFCHINIDFHMIIHVKVFLHIDVHVKSYEKLCDMWSFKLFLLNFLLVNI